MSMSDCPECWSTPCDCGYDYKGYGNEYFSKFISNILSYKSKEDAILILENAIEIIKNKK